jgi:hypothetical protein
MDDTQDRTPGVTGERAGLLAIARHNLRFPARDLTGEQAGQRTTLRRQSSTPSLSSSEAFGSRNGRAPGAGGRMKAYRPRKLM